MCTRAKELAFGLKIREFGAKFCLEEREFGEGFAKKVLGKGVGAKRVSKESGAGGIISRGVPWVSGKKV